MVIVWHSSFSLCVNSGSPRGFKERANKTKAAVQSQMYANGTCCIVFKAIEFAKLCFMAYKNC